MLQVPQITKEEVARIASLARMQLSEEELETTARDLQGILDHFAAIQDIDTTGVPTSDDASGLANITRKDEVGSEALASHEELIDAAPDTKDGQVKVKAVF